DSVPVRSYPSTIIAGPNPSSTPLPLPSRRAYVLPDPAPAGRFSRRPVAPPIPSRLAPLPMPTSPCTRHQISPADHALPWLCRSVPLLAIALLLVLAPSASSSTPQFPDAAAIVPPGRVLMLSSVRASTLPTGS